MLTDQIRGELLCRLGQRNLQDCRKHGSCAASEEVKQVFLLKTFMGLSNFLQLGLL